jgi:hypothetical protein
MLIPSFVKKSYNEIKMRKGKPPGESEASVEGIIPSSGSNVIVRQISVNSSKMKLNSEKQPERPPS